MRKSFIAAALAVILASSIPAAALLNSAGEKSSAKPAAGEAAAPSAGAFTGSTPLVQYLYHQFTANPSSLTVPVDLFSSADTEQRFEELGKAAIEAYIQNGLTDYVMDFQYNYTGGDSKIIMDVFYNNQNEASRQSMAKALDQKAAQILAQTLKPGMTDRQKAEALNNYVAQNVHYDFTGYQAYQAGQNVYDLQTAYAALVGGKAICQGFARAYKLLCDKAGVPCVVLFGTTKQYGTAHAWNRVKLDGKWETVDSSNPALAINHVGSFCIPQDVVDATLVPEGAKTLMDTKASLFLS